MGVLIYISEVSSGDSWEGRKRSIFRLSCLFSVIHIGALNSHRNSDSINLESKSLCTSVSHLHATNQEHLGRQTDRESLCTNAPKAYCNVWDFKSHLSEPTNADWDLHCTRSTLVHPPPPPDTNEISCQYCYAK